MEQGGSGNPAHSRWQVRHDFEVLANLGCVCARQGAGLVVEKGFLDALAVRIPDQGTGQTTVDGGQATVGRRRIADVKRACGVIRVLRGSFCIPVTSCHLLVCRLRPGRRAACPRRSLK